MPDIPENFADAVRRSYEHPVDDATAERHVAAMVREAREVVAPPAAPSHASVRRRRRALRPALAAGVAALVLPGGLAVAGVNLPDAVKAPYDVVGIDLPNQASDTARDRVPEAVPARTTPGPAEDRPASPAVPDGGVREGHGADDQRARQRRSEERNKRRRGDERRRENRPRTEMPKPTRPKTPPAARPAGPPRGADTPRPARPASPRPGTKQKTTPVRPSAEARPKAPARSRAPRQKTAPQKPARPQKQPEAAEPAVPYTPEPLEPEAAPAPTP